jgi:glycosyltransferase involved in cell wall biosynthesis
VTDVLYLSFDGMTDPLGRSQVLPYLTGLGARGHRIRIVSLEKADAYDREAWRVDEICRQASLEWHPLPYRTRPPLVSTVLNLRTLRRTAERLHRERPADFSHCRSDLPGIAGLKLKRRHGLPLLYDMRAFWPDERAEGGQWDQSKALYRWMFRYFKRRQRELLAEADEIVTLSEAGRRAVTDMRIRDAGAPITVIPCCADFDLFAPPQPDQRATARAELGVDPAAPLLIHVGSIGCNCLLDEMLDFFAVYRERHGQAQFLFVAPAGESTVRASARDRGVGEAVHFRSASREEVAGSIGAADLGIMFVRPVWSKAAASPTKLGEMLAAGLPVVANSGVGDVAEIVRESGAGVVVDRFDADAYRTAIATLDGMHPSAADIREAGRRWFDLATGITRYDAIYRRLGGKEEPAIA